MSYFKIFDPDLVANLYPSLKLVPSEFISLIGNRNVCKLNVPRAVKVVKRRSDKRGEKHINAVLLGALCELFYDL